MATVTYDGQILTDAEAISDATYGGTWNEWMSAKAPALETDFVLQGTYSISEKISASTGGVTYTDATTVDYTSATAVRVVIAKAMVSTTGIIDTTIANGNSYQIGSSTSDYYNYYLSGLYAGPYPTTRSWRIIVIDPNVIAWRDAVAGTPSLTAVDVYGWYADITGSAKAENVIHDRLDYLPHGTGHTLTGTSGVFQDFIDYDEGDSTTTGRMMIVSTGEAEILVFGVLTLGTATSLAFSDSNFVVVFPTARVDEGFFGIDMDLQNASTDITFNAGVFKSLGNASTKLFFDTALEIDGTNNEIDITAHGFETGDYVLYSNEGGADTIGLTSGTYYFVRAVTANSLAFYAVGATVGRQNSFTDTTRVALTTQTAPGENHSLIRYPDLRADHTVSGTSGSVAWNSCSLDGVKTLTLTSGASIDGGFLIRAGNVTGASSSTITGLSVQDQTTTEGVALFDLTETDNMTDCSFDGTDTQGHLWRITSNTNSPFTSNNEYTGYWAYSPDSWKFDGNAVATNVITTDSAHGHTDGDAVYYHNNGNTSLTGLTHLSKYYAHVLTTTTFTLHNTRAAAIANSSIISITASAGVEEHHIYSSRATIFNDSGAAITVNVTTGSTSPSFRNGSGASTTIVASVPVEITVIDQDGIPISTAQTAVYLTSDDSEIINQDTNGSGIASGSFSGTTPANVYIRVRKSSTGATRYVNNSAVGVIGTSGLSATITMRTEPLA